MSPSMVERYNAHILELTDRALEGDECAIKSLCAIALAKLEATDDRDDKAASQG